MSKKLKNIGVVSLLTIISRVLGVARDSIALALFGAATLMSSFYTAYTLPNLFRRLLAEGSLSAAFVPTLQEELHRNGRPGVFKLVSQVGSWLLVVTTAIAALAMLIFSQSRRLPGHDPKWYVTADLTVILFPYLALISLAAAFSAALNVLEHFTEPALSPIWLNLAMIASMYGAGLHWAVTDLGRMHWLCAGVLAGGVMQMGVPGVVLIILGWRPRLELVLSDRVREIARLMTPGLVGTAIYQINIAVGRLLAFTISNAGVTEMYSANRLMEFPIGVFAIAISTVVYPLIAKHAAAGNQEALADDFIKGLRLILLINIPAAIGMALLSAPIVRLLYEHGKVTPEAAHQMATLVALFAIGMPFFSIVNLTVRAFYAVKDIATPVRIAAVDFVINIVMSLSLMRWLGVPGLVLASTSAIIAQSLLYRRALQRRLPHVRLALLWPSLVKILAASAVMALGLWMARNATLGWRVHRRTTDAAIELVVLIPLGMVIYGIMLFLLRIEGREELAALVARLRKRPSV